MTSAEIQKYPPNKHVLFKEDVTIHSFVAEDKNRGKCRGQVKTQSKCFPSDRQLETNKYQLESVQKRLNLKERTNEMPENEGTLPRPPSFYSVSVLNEEKVVRYSFVKDRMRNTFLQLSVPIGPTYGPKGVMVKSNVHGTKIRVMACSKMPMKTSDGQTVKMEYNETFPLPVAVDPDRVTARVDNLGYLLIGAPVV